MRPIFREQQHQAQFEQDGCVLIEGFASASVVEAEEFFVQTFDAGHGGFHVSLELESATVKAEVDAFLGERLAAPITRHLDGYASLVNLYVSKGSDEGSVVPAHQDWSFVDEREHRSLNLWIPLCDTTERNGALAVVKRSHRLPATVRGTGVPLALTARREAIAPLLSVIPMRAGDALIYDHRMIHASAPNRSGQRRTVATAHLLPQEARAVHCVRSISRPEALLELAVDSGFFHHYRLDRASYGDRSRDYPIDVSGYSGEEIPYAPVWIDDEALHRAAGRRPRPTLGRAAGRAAAKLRAWSSRRRTPPSRS